MRRNSHDMQVNVAGIRRNLKNLAHNYSDAQKKVREATSNDPWGPSSTIMAEVADLTYNVVAFSEIMQMIWKRLNDHGRNWRHVYKALVLLEYLIKTGSEKVGQQCKENIFAIQTLKDFQYMEDGGGGGGGKDQGQNVREKAKQLVNLLKDDERLKNERTRALKAKERFAQSASGFGSDGGLDMPSSPKYPAFRGGDWGASGGNSASGDVPREIENARPQTAGEEELQLQLALAMSREEADQEEQKRKSDDVRLQLALSQSQQDFKITDDDKPNSQRQPSHMVDLLDVNLGEGPPIDPWGMPQPPRPQQSTSPWPATALSSPPRSNNNSKQPLSTTVQSSDPWQPPPSSQQQQFGDGRLDPWTGGSSSPSQQQQLSALSSSSSLSQLTTVTTTMNRNNDPWSPTSHHHGSSSDLDEFDVITNRNRSSSINNKFMARTTSNGNSNNLHSTSDPFELNLLGDMLGDGGSTSQIVGPLLGNGGGAVKKTPQSFLGENSALVNLDNLVSAASKPLLNPAIMVANPFSDIQNQQQQQQQRPVFNTAPPPKPSINEIKQASFSPFTTTGGGTTTYNNNTAAIITSGGIGGMVTQDPWAPVQQQQTNNNTSTQLLGAPWMMKTSEPANPFLS